MNEMHVALASRLEQVLVDLERIVSRAEMQMAKALQTNDDSYLDAVALNLHGFYTGVERAFEDIAQTMSESLPSGPNWHQKLLLQMASKFPGKRPQVIAVQTRYCLDEYRQFRHVVRNVYTFNLYGSRLKELAEGVRDCFTAVSTDLSQFMQFLHQLGNENDTV